MNKKSKVFITKVLIKLKSFNEMSNRSKSKELKTDLLINVQRVDLPKIGRFGSTNDGNTSRRAFTYYKEFAEITEVKEEVSFETR